MAAPESTALPAAPSRADDGETFAAKADAFVGALEPFRQQLQEQADFVDLQITEFDSNLNQAVADATQTAVDASATAQASAATATQAESNAETYRSEAQDARDSALAVVNFAGKWSDLAGALNTPATVFHNGAYWNLLNNLADVTTSEPANDNGDWLFVYTNAELRRKLLDEATLYADFVNGDYRLYEGVGAGVVRGKAFSDLFAFTRPSDATAQGVSALETVSSDVPRFVYTPDLTLRLGLLVEGQSTNFLLWSQDFDNAVWTKVGASVSANVEKGPDGSQSADKLVEDNSTGTHRVSQSANLAAGECAFTALVKPAERTKIKLTRLSTQQDDGPSIDLNSLAVTGINASRTIVKRRPDGWITITCVFTLSATGTAGYTVDMRDDTGSNSYTGDGASGIHIGGFQLEGGSIPTTLIPTTSAQLSRSIENCSRTLAQEFNASEGTLFWKFRADGRTTNSAVGFFGADFNDRVVFFDDSSISTSSNNSVFSISKDGSAVANISLGELPLNTTHTVALSFSKGVLRGAVNGTSYEVSFGGDLPAVTRLTGQRLGGNTEGLPFRHHLSINYIPRLFSRQELAAITQPEGYQ